MSGAARDNNDFYQSIDEKLDTVVSGQTSLSIRLEALERQVLELNRTVRGYNGTPGLVTEVALVKEALKKSPYVDSRFITWEWLIDRAAMPVVVAFLIWFLLKFLPEVAVRLGITGGG